MWALTEAAVGCPYCGESIVVLLNPEDIGMPYIEDCQVCCRPIEFLVCEDGSGALTASLSTDTE